MPNFLSKLLSLGSDRELKEFERLVAKVNELEPSFEAMSEEELRGCTEKFSERYNQGETLDDLQTFDALDFCRALVGEGM